MKGFKDRLEKHELRDRSAVSPVSPDLVRRFMKRHEDTQVTVRERLPGNHEGHAAEASAGVVLANIKCNIINDTESCYLSLFLNDLSDALDDSSKLIDSKTIALLGSSTSIDSLILMHNRTGHFNMKTLIESHKSKLVKGLKIKDPHIRKFNKSDKHVSCDVCAAARKNYKNFVQENSRYPGAAQFLSTVRRRRVTVTLFNSSTTQPNTVGSIR